MSRSIPFYRTIQKKLDRIGLITDENLAGVRVIRAFSRQSAEQDRFEQANEDYRRTSMQVGRISALLSPLTFVVVNLAIVAIIRFGAVQVKIGALTQGQIVALVNYMNQILLALVVVTNLVVIFTRAAASAARVSEVLAMEPSIQNPQRKIPAEDSDAPVSYTHLDVYKRQGRERLRRGADFVYLLSGGRRLRSCLLYTSGGSHQQ